MRKIRRFSFNSPGRLIVAPKQGLRARSVCLPKNALMDWHSTGKREELLLVIAGSLTVDAGSGKKTRRINLACGEGVFLPLATRHRVTNRFSQAAAYVYVTGRA